MKRIRGATFVVITAALLFALLAGATAAATEFESPVSPLPTPWIVRPEPMRDMYPPAAVPTPRVWFVGDRVVRER